MASEIGWELSMQSSSLFSNQDCNPSMNVPSSEQPSPIRRIKGYCNPRSGLLAVRRANLESGFPAAERQLRDTSEDPAPLRHSNVSGAIVPPSQSLNNWPTYFLCYVFVRLAVSSTEHDIPSEIWPRTALSRTQGNLHICTDSDPAVTRSTPSLQRSDPFLSTLFAVAPNSMSASIPTSFCPSE